MYATAMLSPVEIKSKMSHVTLAWPIRSALALAMRKFGVTGVVALPPVSDRSISYFVNIFVDIPPIKIFLTEILFSIFTTHKQV